MLASPRALPGQPLRAAGRRALLAVALLLTLLWGALAGAWLSTPPETAAQRQLRGMLRAYGRGEPYLVPSFVTPREPCDEALTYGGIDSCVGRGVGARP